MRQQVPILRVERSVAGAYCPFDKIYFFRRDEEHAIPKVFPSCLVLDINRPLARMLRQVMAPDLQMKYIIPPVTDGKAYPLKRFDESVLAKKTRRGAPVLKVLDNRRQYLAVVPTLFQSAMKRTVKSLSLAADPGISTPLYLCSSKFKPGEQRQKYIARNKNKQDTPLAADLARKNKVRLIQRGFSGAEKLYIHGTEVKPVCALCPDSLLMLAGACSFGHGKCYAKLTQQEPSAYVRNMKNYWRHARKAAEKGEVDVEL